MIIWVRKEAIGERNDQRATIRYVSGRKIHIRLLGTDATTWVWPQDIVGVDITENLTVFLKYRGYSYIETTSP